MSDFVSVVMLTMNRPQYVDSAIRSVVAQDHAQWELIVVQDGPDVRIAPRLQPWLDSDARIRFYRREQIGNIANGMNFAIQQSRGGLIAVLDDDDAWITPRKLSMQIDAFRHTSDLVAIGGGAIVIDAEGRETMRYSRALEPALCARRALLANPLIHSTTMFRRSAWLQAGGYDETLPGYQDWDLFLKMMRVGKVGNLPQPLATYRVWDGGGTSRKVLGNAWSSLRITWRHRSHFSHGAEAVAASVAYILFALLPSAFRCRLYQGLSRFKKHLFSTEILSS